MSFTSVGDAIPQLADLSYSPVDSRPISLGGQNFTHCCLKAMNSSLEIQDGNLTFTNSSFFMPDMTINTLETAIKGDQFPCGASWNGDPAGAPVVEVPYSWCAAECSGWEISHFSILQQWVGPLVQFILPSLAFCLNIPRMRKLAIPHAVFRAHPRSVVGFASYWIRLLGAVLLMTVDTMVWLSICFAFAGPMLLSTVYEFVLDRKILEFLCPPSKRGERPAIPGKLKAQLLLAVVVGNIRISTNDDKGGATTAQQESYDTSDPECQKDKDTAEPIITDNTWKRVMAILGDMEKTQQTGHPVAGLVSLPTKLKAILNSQASFGSSVGGPILFFVGGFIYTVLDIGNSLGDDDQAHALAFGMWWMTIPYLAIVSCAMLASNSPSALQGIVYDGGPDATGDQFEESFWDQVKAKIKSNPLFRTLIKQLDGYELVEYSYEGHFRTVTLWNRGTNKRRWVYEAINDYEKNFTESRGHVITPDELRKALRMKFSDLFNIIFGALYLLIAPSLMAFVTSYNVPRVGLACRSLTYLVYAISQVCEMIFWSWEARLKAQYGAKWSETKTPAKAISWWGQVFAGFFAVLAAVGGTFMQLLGVYRTCACKIPIMYWVRLDDPEAYLVLSTNSADSIEAAQRWWTVTGSVAVAALGVVCALAWWHQRRLRKVFRDEANSLENNQSFTAVKSSATMKASSGSTSRSPSHHIADICDEHKIPGLQGIQSI